MTNAPRCRGTSPSSRLPHIIDEFSEAVLILGISHSFTSITGHTTRVDTMWRRHESVSPGHHLQPQSLSTSTPATNRFGSIVSPSFVRSHLHMYVGDLARLLAQHCTHTMLLTLSTLTNCGSHVLVKLAPLNQDPVYVWSGSSRLHRFLMRLHVSGVL